MGIPASLAFMMLLQAAGGPGESWATSQVSRGVALSVFVSRDPVGRPEIRAIVSNNTSRRIAVWDNCYLRSGMFTELASREERELQIQDPAKRPEFCPDTLLTLSPEGLLEARFPVPDTLYTWNSVPKPMLPGTYFVGVRFEWREDVLGTRHTITHALAFDWPLATDTIQVGGPGGAIAPEASQSKPLPSESVSGTGALRGMVLDSLTSKALGFAPIHIVRSDLTLPVKTENIFLWYGAKTINARGKGDFLFENLPVGSYDVRVSYICYARDTARVMVTKGDTVMVRFRLRRSVENTNCKW